MERNDQSEEAYSTERPVTNRDIKQPITGSMLFNTTNHKRAKQIWFDSYKLWASSAITVTAIFQVNLGRSVYQWWRWLMMRINHSRSDQIKNAKIVDKPQLTLFRAGRAVKLVAWHSGRTSDFGLRTFLSCARFSCRVTTYVGKPSAIGQPTRPTQPFVPLGTRQMSS